MQDTVLISYVNSVKSDNPILLVGRKRMNQTTEVINAFQGDEATELYKRLVTKKVKTDGDNG